MDIITKTNNDDSNLKKKDKDSSNNVEKDEP